MPNFEIEWRETREHWLIIEAENPERVARLEMAALGMYEEFPSLKHGSEEALFLISETTWPADVSASAYAGKSRVEADVEGAAWNATRSHMLEDEEEEGDEEPDWEAP